MAEGLGDANPGFVEIIRQLTTDEAKLVSHLAQIDKWELEEQSFELIKLGAEAGCQRPEPTEAYLNNIDQRGCWRWVQ